MARTQHPNVYLDLTHLDSAFINERFPGIAALCKGFDLDITRDRIPVRPGAHYMVGGVTIDNDGRTSLPGLWAAGEVTSSGLHGANRLASNSLLEGLARCDGMTRERKAIPTWWSDSGAFVSPAVRIRGWRFNGKSQETALP